MSYKIFPRYIKSLVEADLQHKMVFVGGPRQVGKTTFALSFLPEPSEDHPAYLNWDDVSIRSSLLQGQLPLGQRIIILDEIHKFARWRNLVKGFYDKNKTSISFLITGSARLDYYSKGGDSLHGRYHYYRLHPLSLRELGENPGSEELEGLLRFGGFPEPYFRAEERFWRRWQRERVQRVIYEDIRDLENVKEISLLELLATELPNRVGSPLSVKKLKELLEVSHATVERWLKIFERMYYCFRVPPYGSPRVRAVKKEQKLYMWDWSIVPEHGPRFENLVASQLLKFCHFMEDTEGYHMELRFLRDTDKREVDFVILRDRQPIFAVECKTGDKNVNPALFYFRERTHIPRFYQVHLGQREYIKDRVQVLHFKTFCNELNLP